jgi:hypothetical protein
MQTVPYLTGSEIIEEYMKQQSEESAFSASFGIFSFKRNAVLVLQAMCQHPATVQKIQGEHSSSKSCSSTQCSRLIVDRLLSEVLTCTDGFPCLCTGDHDERGRLTGGFLQNAC